MTKQIILFALIFVPFVGFAAEKELCVDSVCTYETVNAAFAVAKDNAVITISGEWTMGGVLSANGVTIKGLSGAHLKGGAVQGKAAMVITGNNTRIEDLECSGVTVPDENGACVRLEGKNLTLDNVHFRDSQNGILTTTDVGLVQIIDSTFERNGFNGGGGYAHGIYVNGGDTELLISNSKFLSTKLGGHAIKSRAAKTTIQNSVIATLDGVDSRSIDIPNGGVVVIKNNVIEQGPKSENSTAIGIGLEGVEYNANSVLIEDNYIILERTDSNRLLHTDGVPAPVLRNNTVIGGEDPQGTNTWYASRSAANIAAYPYLPTVKGVSVPVVTAPVATSPYRPTSGAFVFTSYLVIGSRGQEVSQLQSTLSTLGFFNHEVTGYYGPITAAAVSAFQSKSALPAVGVVGPMTRTLLNSQR